MASNCEQSKCLSIAEEINTMKDNPEIEW
jgi:hypothetical protein